MTPTVKEAYALFHKGSLAFARMEESGIAVDVAYLKATIKSLGQEIVTLTDEMQSDQVWQVWQKAYGDKAALNSRPQLADVIFKRLGHPARARTESGDKDSTEESAFRGINLPFIGRYFRLQKLQKLRSTYFKNILREQQDGFLHPSFNLHTVQTYRSCIARDSMIMCVADDGLHTVLKPIQDVKPGDRVFCYDDRDRLTHLPVTHAWKTGRRKVLNMHFLTDDGRDGGSLKLTPGHRVRITGRINVYEEARMMLCTDGRCRGAWLSGGECYEREFIVDSLARWHREEDVYDLEVPGADNFIANGVCVHNSSSEPNFQNVPTRDPLLGKMIRKAFIARPGNHLVEVDLAGAEVRVAYCYHLDPTMRDYLLDESTDMHRDTASDLLCLPVDFLIKNKDWAKKTVRDWAKNRFVFPQFYGSVYFQCAPHIWEALTETLPDGKPKYPLPDGTDLLTHLKAHNINSLGDCDPKRPAAPGTFEYHVQKVQRSFWETRFPVYTEWKDRWLRNYQAKGYFDLHTGFRCHGLFRRNQVINYPVQGASFHILLYAIILMQEYIDRHKMKSLLIGQIHDSLIADVPPDELQDYLTALHHIITVTVPKRWPWITIPMQIEAEVCGVGESWDKKAVWVNAGEWKRK